MELILKENFVEETNAIEKHYVKGDELLTQQSKSYHFFYLLEGEVSVYNIADEGKVFLHHKVPENNFFGEPAVILDIPFPGYISVTSDNARVLRIPREKLIEYLKNHPEWSFEFLGSVAEKSMRKSKLLRSIIFLNPEERILMHFKEFKRGATEKMLIDLTRKELSTMTGLRIETVIRTIKKMEQQGKLEIIKGKVYY
jgi:CRP-like cAMP-binding protein